MTDSDEMPGGHGKPCYYCGEPCNDLAGNPSQWSVPGCHADNPGRVKWHHIGCVFPKADRAIAAESERDAALARVGTLERHHEITETHIGLARVAIQRGDLFRAGQVLDRCCDQLDALTPPAYPPEQPL